MVFIRIKKINNIPYAYLVENINTAKGSRQKVKQYLGRVYRFPESENISMINEKNILLKLVLEQLNKYGFKQKGQFWKREQFVFCPKYFTLKKKNMEAILATNNGFVSSFTLQRIKGFKKTKNMNKDAPELAKYFLEAGLNVTKADFISYYQQL